MLSKLVLVVVVLVAAGAIAAATTHGQTLATGQTLVLRVDLTKSHQPHKVAAGSIFVDRASIERNGKLDGFGHEACVVTFPFSKTRIQFQCDEFLSLNSAGTITAQGIDNLNFAKGGPQPATFAITGGTGTYDGARGEITTQPKQKGPEIWTVHLLPQ